MNPAASEHSCQSGCAQPMRRSASMCPLRLLHPAASHETNLALVRPQRAIDGTLSPGSRPPRQPLQLQRSNAGEKPARDGAPTALREGPSPEYPELQFDSGGHSQQFSRPQPSPAGSNWELPGSLVVSQHRPSVAQKHSWVAGKPDRRVIAPGHAPFAVMYASHGHVAEQLLHRFG